MTTTVDLLTERSVSEYRQDKTKVLVIDDSLAARVLLKHLLESDPAIDVVGTTDSGMKALDAVMRYKPDVVTIDLFMPEMDGIETTQTLMANCPVPIIIVTANRNRADVPFKMLDAGALAVIEKPPGPGHPDFVQARHALLRTVKSISGVKLVRRAASTAKFSPDNYPCRPTSSSVKEPRIVAIGASTGGPQVLKAIVAGLPADFPLPIVVAQHMAPGFLEGLITWLNDSRTVLVKAGTNNEPLRPGVMYLAPDNFQMGITPSGHIKLVDADKEYGVRPSVSYLFRSVAESYKSEAIALLLTGMGRDGAEELAVLRKAQAITIAQDRESSVVHGMPGVALALGAASMELSPTQMIAELKKYVKSETKQ